MKWYNPATWILGRETESNLVIRCNNSNCGKALDSDMFYDVLTQNVYCDANCRKESGLSSTRAGGTISQKIAKMWYLEGKLKQ